MGKRGPPRIPTEILIARGSRHARGRTIDPPPVPERKAPRRPAWLTPKAAKVWDELIPILQAMGVLSPADGATISRYCQSLVDWVELDAAVRKEGQWYTAANGSKRVHPATRLRKEAAIVLEKCEDRLGLTPAARSGLHLTLAWRPATPQPITPAPAQPTGEQPKPAPAPIDGERFFKRT